MLIELNFCRYWGECIARNVYAVVAVSLVLVLILCTGLLRFSVETDLEKVSTVSIFSKIMIREQVLAF